MGANLSRASSPSLTQAELESSSLFKTLISLLFSGFEGFPSYLSHVRLRPDFLP